MCKNVTCRLNCGACCIAPSISTPIPDMPNGKLAGMSCTHLDENFSCKIFNQPNRPKVCAQLKPSIEMCGNNRDEAMAYLSQLEELTKP